MKHAAIVIFFLATLIAPSWAFYEQGSQVLNLEAGWTLYSFKADIPQSSLNSSPNTVTSSNDAGSLGAGYLYYINPRLGVGLAGHYTSRSGGTPVETIFNSITTDISA